VASGWLADAQAGPFAAAHCRSEHRPIRSRGDLEGHVLAWYADDPIAGIPEFEALRPKLPEHIRLQSNTLTVHAQAALSGVGLAVMPTYTAARNDALVRILPDEIGYRGHYWVLVPKTQLRGPTTQRVLDFLAEAVAAAGLAPPSA